MSYVITAIVFSILGFVAGALFFRKNKVKIEQTELNIRDILK